MEEACKVTVSIEDILIQGLTSDLSVLISVVGRTSVYSLPHGPIEILSCRLPSDESLTIDLMENDKTLSQTSVMLEDLMKGELFSKWVNVNSSSSSLSFTSMFDRKPQGKYKLSMVYEDLSSCLPASCPSCTCLERIATDSSSIEIASEETFVKSIVSSLRSPTDYADISDGHLEINWILDSSGPLSAIEAQHTRAVIVGLNDKLKALTGVQMRMQNAVRNENKHRQAREQMEKTIQESVDSMKEYVKNSDKFANEIGAQRDNAANELRSLQKKWNEKCLDEEQLKNEILQKDMEIESLKRQAKLADELFEQSEELRKQIRTLDDSRQNLRDSFDEINQKNEQEIQNLQDRNTELENKILSLSDELAGKDKEIGSLNLEIDSLRTDLSTKKSELSQAHSDIKTKDEMIKRQDELETLVQNFYTSQSELNQELSVKSANFEKALDSAKDQNTSLLGKTEELSSSILSLEKLLTQVKSSLAESVEEKENLKNENIRLQGFLANEKDSESLTKSIKDTWASSEKLKDSVYAELDQITNYMHEQSIQMNNIQKLNNSLKDSAEEKDKENTLLRQMVVDLKRRMSIYVPVKEDPIDMAIADFSNTNHPEIPFVRESLGVYLFGAKRVFVKLENGRVNIRVGGGFMKIEDFVQFYSPAEVERFENKLREEADEKRANILGQITQGITNPKFNTFYAISPVKTRKGKKMSKTNTVN